jgi:hypothetical protein
MEEVWSKNMRWLIRLIRELFGRPPNPIPVPPPPIPLPEPEPIPEPPPPPPPPAIINRYKWRGDFLGDFTRPALMYGGMPDDMRAQIRREHKERGYTHLPLNVHQDYNRFPQWHYHLWDYPNEYLELVDEIENDGLLCIPVFHHYDSQADNVADHIRRVGQFWPHVKHRLGGQRLFMWGYEINGDPGDWKNGTKQLEYLSRLHQILGPFAEIAIHFTPERWAGWPGFDGQEQDKDEYAWLRKARSYNATVLLYQAAPDTPENAVIHRCFQLPAPFNYRPGIAGRVEDGANMRFVLYEYSRNTDRGIRIGTKAMTFETCSGFGNGGPIL